MGSALSAGVFVAISRGCLRCPTRYTQGFNAAGPTFRVDLFWAFVIRCLSAFSVARATSCLFRVVSAPRMSESPAIRIRVRPVPRLSLPISFAPRSTSAIRRQGGIMRFLYRSFHLGQAFSFEWQNRCNSVSSLFYSLIGLTPRSSGPGCAGPLNFFR